MLAVVKTPRTEIKIKGVIPAIVLDALKKEYGKKLLLKREKAEEKLLNVFKTPEYKSFKKSVNPGDYVKVYRENLQLTQAQLGEKLGVTRAYICDIEKGRRAVSKVMAKKLSKIFDISVSCFI